MKNFEIESVSCVMAIFAHPDDAEIAAGGTLRRYVDHGTRVILVTICQGDKGSSTVEARKKEEEQARIVLGVDALHSLGYPDGECENDLTLRGQLVELIRKEKPDVVLCPDPTAVFFSHAYINHRDHRQTGWAVLDVVSSAVGNPKYFPTTPAHHVRYLLCAGTEQPNCVVDISDSIKFKIEAVSCYESQLGDSKDRIDETVRAHAASSGRDINVAFGESFRYSQFSPPLLVE